MSFMSNYYAELKKLKKKEEELDSKGTAPYRDTSANKAASSSEGSFMDRFYEELSKAEAEEEDIAPILPVLPSVRNYSSKPWYKKGHFEDGYDIGDVTKTILGIDEDSASLKELTWGSLKKGYQNARYGEESFYAMEGKANQKEAYEKLLESEEYQFTPGNKLASGISGAFELLGQQARQFTHPRTLALTGGAAGMAAIAGQAGPQVLVPEEVVSVPIAAMAGFKTGSTASALEIEAGLAYNEMLEYGIKEETARKIALGVGSINAGLEALQVDELLDAYKITSATGATKSFTKRVLKELADRGIDVAKETAQEVAQEGVTIAGTQIASKHDKGEYAYSAEDVAKRLLETAQSSALSFGMMNVPAVAKNTVSIAKDQGAISNEKKMTGSLTENEQKVVNKVVEDIVSGREVSQKHKNEITKSVIERMEKGYISTDTIEEVLGGDSYQAYKDSLDAENTLKEEQKTLQEEFKTLGGKTNATLAEQARYTELGQKLTEIQAKLDDANTIAERNALKAQLDKEVYELTKGDKLRESFFEVVRSKQKYEADLSKYEGKAKEVIKQVMDSKLVDNSNQTHEFWDLMANLSARGDTTISVANDEQILELVKKQHEEEGLEFDESRFKGQRIDGFTDGKRIVLNAQTERALNFVVGHEITHNLEKTKHYGSLQKILIEFAGDDYTARFNERQGQYANKFAQDEKFNSKVNMEVTGDLVGDYLFTNKDFVTHLAKDRNVFQRVWDEIKYFCKIATAGSEQKRQLEQVKREFERAWRETQKNTADGGAKYSIGEIVDENKKSYGVGVHLDSTLLDNLTPSERLGMVKEYVKELGGESFTAFDPNGNAVDITIAKHGEKFVNQNGKRIPANKDLATKHIDNEVKQESIALIDELVVTAEFDDSKPPRYPHGWLDNNGQNNWEYWTTYVQDKNNTIWKATLNVANTTDGEKILYDISPIKKVGRSVKSDALPTDTNVTQNGAEVKGKFSVSDGSLGYHAGDLGKAEGYWNMVSSNRGTGHFGTGTYFVGDEAKISDSHYGNRPHEKVDFSKYHLFKPLFEEQGFELHSTLKYINDKISKFPIAKMSFDEMWDVRKKADDAEYILWDEDATDAEKAEAQKTLDDLAAQFEDVGYDPESWSHEELFEALHDISREYQRTRMKLGSIFFRDLHKLDFDARDAKIDSVMQSIYDEVSQIEDAYAARYEDSPSTRFMKAMGYEGIDVRGFRGLDNTTYGSVIYDLKGEDLARKKEIGTAKYSVSDSDGKQLTKEQQEYFKDSKVRDESGRLLPVYHGSKNSGFNVFRYSKDIQTGTDYGEAYYFTSDRQKASGYSYDVTKDERVAQYQKDREALKNRFLETRSEEDKNAFLNYRYEGKKLHELIDDEAFLTDGGEVKEVYLNLTNPLIMDADGKYYYEVYQDYFNLARANGNDGIIVKNVIDNPRGEARPIDTYIAFRPEQIKRTDNTKPTADPDIRFSLSNAVEETKDLIAVHNLHASELAETLKLSGLPSPSVAIINAKEGHDKYGDVSLILPKDAIDPQANKASNVPTGYFEAKPQRVVGFDEVAVFVIPYDADVKLKQELLNRGYAIAEYDPKVDGDRTKVLNQFEEYKFSLSDVGETPYQGKQYGTWNVYAKDMMWKPEEIAPVGTVSNMESVAPVMEEPLPDAESYSDLLAKKADLESKMMEAVGAEDFDTFNQINEEYSEVMARIEDMEQYDQERVDSLDDAEAPPEMEAPYYGEVESTMPENPFDDRDWYTVGNQKVKAYMYENPEVKPFFQEEALKMLGELGDTTRGERWYNDQLYYESGGESGFGGTKRHTSASMEELLDAWGMSYADIEKGLNAIIEDHGAENIAAAKKLEFMINDRLLNGYKDFYTNGHVAPNRDYIKLLNEKQVTEYSQEAFARFMENADAYAPLADDIGPVKATVMAAKAPVVQTTVKYEAIKPKREAQPRMARATPEEQQRIAEILDEEPSVANRKNRAWAKFRANVLDKGSVFEDLSLKTKNRTLMGKWNYMLYSEARAQRLMGNGTGHVKSLNAIREEVGKTGKTKQFYQYLYHKHNIDRMTLEERYEDAKNKPVFGNSVTADDSRKIVDKLEAQNPKFKRYAKDVYGYMTHLRQQLVDGGVISQETAKLWAEMYPNYVPIRRAGDTGLNINVPLDTRKTGVNAPVKRATGGSRDILPLFDTMGQRTIQTYKAIAKNSFGVELKDTLRSTIGNEALSVDDVIDSIDMQDGLLQEGKNGQKPTFTVFENGEKVTFEIDEDMYDALKPVSEGLSYTNKVLNTANNIHRGLLTEYNPVFLLTNAVKDTQDVLINSQHPWRTYAKIPEAYAQLFKKGYWYQEYMDNGGEQNTYFDNQTSTFKEESSGLKKVVKLPLDAISAANNFIEMTPRLAEYIASREAGRSVEVAMLDAARVTTNFVAGGDLTKLLNRNGVTFLNASVQGAMQQVRNVREANANGLKGWANLATKFAVAGLPAILLNNLVWDDDEEYEELSDYVKQNYYIVGKYGDGNFIRIPKGRTLAVIQEGIEQISNALTGNDEVDLANFLELVVTNLAPNNPLDNNIIAPIMQAVKNETWYGEDLVPTRLQDLPAGEQFDESTDSVSKWLGEKLNISPVKINYLLNQYSGGVGDVLLPMITPKAERGNNTLLGNMIAPLKDKFSTDAVMNNQNVSDFYDLKDELTTKAKASAATDEDKLMYKYINSVNAELSELYKQKREIQNSKLSNEAKYSQAREIQEQIVDLMKSGMSAYTDINIDGEYATVGDRYFKQNEEGEWEKLSDEQATKYTVTNAAGDSSYATDGTNHYRWYDPEEGSDSEPGWKKITEDQLEKQEEVTSALRISPEEYWGNKEEYDYAYEYPESYAVAKAVGGYDAYRQYSSELYDIKADKDEYGKSISGSRKEKVQAYINSLNADYYTKLILFKSEYTSYDEANYEIVEYLNNRDDISFEEMRNILIKLGFEVDSQGNISW